jgi:hypothetical protein
MLTVLVVIYGRLARAEEGEVAARFGESWRANATVTPGFTPPKSPERPASARAG